MEHICQLDCGLMQGNRHDLVSAHGLEKFERFPRWHHMHEYEQELFEEGFGAGKCKVLLVELDAMLITLYVSFCWCLG